MFTLGVSSYVFLQDAFTPSYNICKADFFTVFLNLYCLHLSILWLLLPAVDQWNSLKLASLCLCTITMVY